MNQEMIIRRLEGKIKELAYKLGYGKKYTDQMIRRIKNEKNYN